MVSIRLYIRTYKTKQTDQIVDITFQASALVGAWAWIIVQLKFCFTFALFNYMTTLYAWLRSLLLIHVQLKQCASIFQVSSFEFFQTSVTNYLRSQQFNASEK